MKIYNIFCALFFCLLLNFFAGPQTLQAQAPPQITPAGPHTFCQGNSILLTASAVPFIDLDYTTFSTGTVGADQWQSFTPGLTGSLAAVTIRTNSCANNNSTTFTLYEGVGTTGTVLNSQVVVFNGCNYFHVVSLPDIDLVSVANYTFRLQSSTDLFLLGNHSAPGIYFSNSYGTPPWRLSFSTTMKSPLDIVQWFKDNTLIPGATAFSFLASESGAYDSRAEEEGIYSGPSNVVNVNVISPGTISLSSPIGSDVQNMCQNNPINTIIYTTTGVTGATFSGLPPGVSGNWAANVVSISGTPSITGDFPYAVFLTGNPCGASEAFGIIKVNPVSSIVNPPANQILCSNSLTDSVSFSGSLEGTVFNWINDNPSIGLSESGSGDIERFNAVNNGLTPLTATITVTPSFTNEGFTCYGTPVNFTITVNPSPVITNPAVNSAVIGTAFNETFTIMGGISPVLISTPSDLPEGLNFSTSGVLSGHTH